MKFILRADARGNADINNLIYLTYIATHAQ